MLVSVSGRLPLDTIHFIHYRCGYKGVFSIRDAKARNKLYSVHNGCIHMLTFTHLALFGVLLHGAS